MTGENASARAGCVCFVVGELFGVSAVGGGERQIALLAQGLAESGCTISLVARDTGAAAGRPAWPYGPCRWYEGPSGRREKWVSAIRRAVADSRAEVVYQRGTGALTVGAALGAADSGAGLVWAASSDADADGTLARFRRSLRQRVVASRRPASPRTVAAAIADAWLHRRAVRALRGADAVVAQTEAQADALRRRLGEGVPVSVVRSIAPRIVGRAAESRELVLWIGADKPVKRPRVFIDIVRSAPASFDYLMVGKGLEPTAATPGVMPEVRGAVGHSEILDLISRALVVVSTSEVEGFPNVFLEAWSRGVPVLSMGSDPDGAVSESGTGWLCRTPQEAGAVLAQLAADPSEAFVRGARAMAYVEERHSAAASVEAMSGLLGQAEHSAAARRRSS